MVPYHCFIIIIIITTTSSISVHPCMPATARLSQCASIILVVTDLSCLVVTDLSCLPTCFTDRGLLPHRLDVRDQEEWGGPHRAVQGGVPHQPRALQ